LLVNAQIKKIELYWSGKREKNFYKMDESSHKAYSETPSPSTEDASSGSREEEVTTPATDGSPGMPSGSNVVSPNNVKKKVELPPLLRISHPLKHRWVLWHLNNDRSNKTWQAGLSRISSFDSVETFWALFNNICPPSGLSQACDYNVFREGTEPTWEANKGGGRWLISVTEDLDVCWLELLLAMIGEQFGEYSDEICGAVVSKRNKGDKVSIWTRNQKETAGNAHIRTIMEQKLSTQMTANRIRFAEYENFW